MNSNQCKELWLDTSLFDKYFDNLITSSKSSAPLENCFAVPKNIQMRFVSSHGIAFLYSFMKSLIVFANKLWLPLWTNSWVKHCVQVYYWSQSRFHLFSFCILIYSSKQGCGDTLTSVSLLMSSCFYCCEFLPIPVFSDVVIKSCLIAACITIFLHCIIDGLLLLILFICFLSLYLPLV